MFNWHVWLPEGTRNETLQESSRDSNICWRTLPLLALVEYVGIALHVIALCLPALNSHPKHACPRKVPLMASTEWMAEEYPALPLFPSGAPLTYLIQEWSMPNWNITQAKCRGTHSRGLQWHQRNRLAKSTWKIDKDGVFPFLMSVLSTLTLIVEPCLPLLLEGESKG